MAESLSTDQRFPIAIIVAVAGLLIMWAILFGTALSDDAKCRKARQAYFDAGYHAALTRDTKLIAQLGEYRRTYKDKCRE